MHSIEAPKKMVQWVWHWISFVSLEYQQIYYSFRRHIQLWLSHGNGFVLFQAIFWTIRPVRGMEIVRILVSKSQRTSIISVFFSSFSDNWLTPEHGICWIWRNGVCANSARRTFKCQSLDTASSPRLDTKGISIKSFSSLINSSSSDLISSTQRPNIQHTQLEFLVPLSHGFI